MGGERICALSTEFSGETSGEPPGHRNCKAALEGRSPHDAERGRAAVRRSHISAADPVGARYLAHVHGRDRRLRGGWLSRTPRAYGAPFPNRRRDRLFDRFRCRHGYGTRCSRSARRAAPSCGDALMQELAAGTVYVHWLRTESREADVLLARASDALDTIERERCNQVLLPEKRRELALSRIFLRTQLGRYCDEAPRSFRFVHNTHGRPEIDEPSACRRVRFNVSHTQG